MFYCYLHMRPDKEGVHSIFYVGKGNEKRIRSVHRRHNNHHTRIVNKVSVEQVEVHTMECSTEAAAFELEIGIIKCLRRMGVKLCNQTDGGEGVSGFPHPHSAETRAKMSVAKLNIPNLNREKTLPGVIMATNKTGCNGVSWDKKSGTWRAQIQTPQGRKNLGWFHAVDEAIAARKAGEEKYWK